MMYHAAGIWGYIQCTRRMMHGSKFVTLYCDKVLMKLSHIYCTKRCVNDIYATLPNQKNHQKNHTMPMRHLIIISQIHHLYNIVGNMTTAIPSSGWAMDFSQTHEDRSANCFYSFSCGPWYHPSASKTHFAEKHAFYRNASNIIM